MRLLMISLDNKILDAATAPAARMIRYGEENELYIIIPGSEKKETVLSPRAQAWGTGGKKWLQFFLLWCLGAKIIRKFNLTPADTLISAQDPFFAGLVGYCLKLGRGHKLEIQVHGDFFGRYYHRQWFRLALAKFVLKRADRVRVVGERVKQSLLAVGIAADKISVKPIAVHDQKISRNNDWRALYPGYKKIFVWGGRMEPTKNLLWLTEIFAAVARSRPDYLLLLVGGGSQFSTLQKKITDLKMTENIKLAPWVDSFFSSIYGADCLLLPSLSEGYSLVAMEAKAAGIKIIMNDVGVAGYELPASEQVKILPINDREKWLEAILAV